MFDLWVSFVSAALLGTIKNPNKRAKLRAGALKLFRAIRAVYFDDPEFQ